MNKKEMSKKNMKEVKGGFRPEFSVSEELVGNKEFPNMYPTCVPPPNTWSSCLKCESVFVS